MTEKPQTSDDYSTEGEPAAVVKTTTARSTMVHFFVRGLAFILPSILTLVILIWISGVIYDYIIHPTSSVVRFTISQVINESRNSDGLVESDQLPPLKFCGTEYLITKEYFSELKGRPLPASSEESGKYPLNWLEVQLSKTELSRYDKQKYSPKIYVPFGNESVPYVDYQEVAARIPQANMPTTATGIYMELVTSRYFGSLFQLSAVAVVVAIVLIYFAGRLVTVRLGAWFVTKFETGILGRLPVIRNVYGSVKQVTDFLFSERTVEYNRVVAIEYPRKGIWSLAFVTGDSLLELTASTGEPMVSVLVPSSPMPVTGYTMSIPRNEILDLNITVDQAFQFTISCGVLVPPQQKVTVESLQAEITKKLTSTTANFHSVSEINQRERDSLTESSAEESNPATHPNSGEEH